MIEMIKNWIIVLSTIMIFITAIEMILPDNSIKKYAKYVLNLLIVLTILTPLLKIISKNFNPNEISTKAEEYFKSTDYEKDINKYKKKNMKRTLESFKENLAFQCKEILNRNFKKEKFNVEIEAELNEKQRKVEIIKIKVGFYEGTIRKIKPINISKNKRITKDNQKTYDKKSILIKNLIEKEVGVKGEKILVYKLDE